jgi:hypothetical protein
MLPRRALSSSASPPTPPLTHGDGASPPSGSPVARRHRAEAGPAAAAGNARDGAAPSPRRNQLNADVLEVIAEYACGSVEDACALRRTSKGYRRAVDTTVRRLVYVDQPRLNPFVAPESSLLCPAANGGSTKAPLKISFTTLQTALLASTSDFANVAKLAVIAFGTDGAKDEAHEGAACGPRQLYNGGHGGHVISTAPSNALPTNGVYRANVRRLTTHLKATRWFVSEAEAFLLLPRGPDEARPALTHLDVPGFYVPDLDVPGFEGSREHAGRAIGRLIATFGPQLESLTLPFLRKEWLPALEECTKLQHFELKFDIALESTGQDALATDVCRIFARSGAPLETVSFQSVFDTRPMGNSFHVERNVLVALLEAVPTLVEVDGTFLALGDLPPAVRLRMRRVNRTPGPQSRGLTMTPDQQHDLARAFPALEWLMLHATEAANQLPTSIPPSLTELAVAGECTYVAAALERVASLLAEQGRTLADASITVWSTSFDPELKRRLLPFAPVVTKLEMVGGDRSADFEDTMQQLTALHTFTAPSMTFTAPNMPRCLVNGRHTQLRELKVAVVDVSIEALLRACPKLMFVTVKQRNQRLDAPGPGWVFRDSTLLRRPFDIRSVLCSVCH